VRSTPAGASLALRGFLQSPRYFGRHRARLRRALRPPPRAERAARAHWARLTAPAPAGGWAAVHVRRTDYARYADTHPMLGPAYYLEAAELARTPATSPHRKSPPPTPPPLRPHALSPVRPRSAAPPPRARVRPTVSLGPRKIVAPAPATPPPPPPSPLSPSISPLPPPSPSRLPSDQLPPVP
jgi:hypothetical protein